MRRKSKKKHIFIIVVALVCVIFCVRFFPVIVNNIIVDSTPSFEERESSNSSFTVKLKEVYFDDMRFYEFYVIDTKGFTVYRSNDSWRAYDFKDISICDNNDIIVVSGDTGESLYSYKNNNGQHYWVAQGVTQGGNTGDG